MNNSPPFLQDDLLRLHRRMSPSIPLSAGESSLQILTALSEANALRSAPTAALQRSNVDAELWETSQAILQNSRVIDRAIQARQAEARVAAATRAIRSAEEQVVAAALARARAAASRLAPLPAPVSSDFLLNSRLDIPNSVSLLRTSAEEQHAASKAAMLATLQGRAATRHQRFASALSVHQAHQRMTTKDVVTRTALPSPIVAVREPSPTFRASPLQKPKAPQTDDCKLGAYEDGPESINGFVPLAIEQDQNWLSECQCVLRADFIEIFQATRKEFNGTTGGSTEYQQVGIRCRFCAHLPSGQRTSRSSAFPSSIKQLYQSFTMMQRDHFQKCQAVPPEKRQCLEALRKTNTQGACDSKQYWIYAAQTLGMFDTHRGIEITPESRAAGRKMPFYGVQDNETAPGIKTDAGPLVHPTDARKVHPFLYTLLQQLLVVELLPSEQAGKRKSLPVGFCGLGCRFCCQKGRLGFSRSFPLRRKTLPAKLDDLFTHVLRCPTCPNEVKTQLATLAMDGRRSAYQNTEIMDRVWKQLGRDGDVSF